MYCAELHSLALQTWELVIVLGALIIDQVNRAVDYKVIGVTIESGKE